MFFLIEIGFPRLMDHRLVPMGKSFLSKLQIELIRFATIETINLKHTTLEESISILTLHIYIRLLN